MKYDIIGNVQMINGEQGIHLVRVSHEPRGEAEDNIVVENYNHLLSIIGDMTETQLWNAINTEVMMGGNRETIVTRMHQKYSTMLIKRQRAELKTGVLLP